MAGLLKKACLQASVLLALVVLQGCSLHIDRDVHVTVRDIESGAPISGAEVVAAPGDYLFTLINRPKVVRGVTDADGNATLRAAWISDQSWSAEAPGYLGSGPEESLSQQQKPPIALTFLLYKAPPATLTIVVPKGHRGWVRVVNQNGPSVLPPRRHFRFEVSNQGRLVVTGDKLVQIAWNSGRRTFEYSDATPIPTSRRKDGTDAIGIQFIEGYDDRELWLVGTQDEADQAYLQLDPSRGLPRRYWPTAAARAAFDRIFEERD